MVRATARASWHLTCRLLAQLPMVTSTCWESLIPISRKDARGATVRRLSKSRLWRRAVYDGCTEKSALIAHMALWQLLRQPFSPFRSHARVQEIDAFRLFQMGQMRESRVGYSR